MLLVNQEGSYGELLTREGSEEKGVKDKVLSLNYYTASSTNRGPEREAGLVVLAECANKKKYI